MSQYIACDYCGADLRSQAIQGPELECPNCGAPVPRPKAPASPATIPIPARDKPAKLEPKPPHKVGRLSDSKSGESMANAGMFITMVTMFVAIYAGFTMPPLDCAILVGVPGVAGISLIIAGNYRMKIRYCSECQVKVPDYRSTCPSCKVHFS